MNVSARVTAGRVALHAAFGVLALAALVKFMALDEFARALLTWDLLPHAWAPWLSIGVPCFEAGLAGAWFLGVGRRVVLFGHVAMLFLFSSALAVQLVAARPPTCGCFGPLLRFNSAMAEAWFALGRNGVLAVLLLVGAWLARGKGGRSGPAAWNVAGTGSGRPPTLHHARAFTLVELLVVLALVGVLVSLVLPSLRGVRRASQVAVSLSNLRSHAGTMTLYTSDNGESFPYFTDPNATVTLFPTPMGSAKAQFFTLHLVWNFPMSADYYAGNPFHASFRMPYAEFSGASAYHYADCFIARPEFWNYATRIGPSQWTGTRLADVQFPSLKGLLRERHTWIEAGTGRGVTPGEGRWASEPIRFSRVDGSAGGTNAREFEAFIRSGVAGWPTMSYLGYGLPIMHTMDGVRGRDVK